MHGDFAASEFADEVELGHAGGFRGLAERDFLGGEKADGEVQCSAALGGYCVSGCSLAPSASTMGQLARLPLA